MQQPGEHPSGYEVESLQARESGELVHKKMTSTQPQIPVPQYMYQLLHLAQMTNNNIEIYPSHCEL